MEVKSRDNNIIIRVIFIVILIFIGFIITNLIVDGLRNARVNILVAPYGATVKIDGKEINGSTRFYPKNNVEVEISKDGFLPKKINIDLEGNKTALVHTYLLDEKNGFDKYRENIHDYDVLKLVADEAAKDFIYKTDKAKSINQILPIETVVGVETTTLYEVEGDELKKCPTFLCLRVEGVNNNDYIKKLLNEYGYNFNDYSFI